MRHLPRPPRLPDIESHILLRQDDRATALGRLRLAGAITGGRGVTPPPPLRVYGSYAVVGILRGRGTYRDTGGATQPVRAGDVIIVLPEQAHWYGPRRGERWDEFYVTFDGPAFDLWRQAGVLGAASPVVPAPAGWVENLRSLVEATPPTAPAPARGQQVADFLALLTRLLPVADAAPPSDTAPEPLWLRQARAHLETDLATPLDLAAVASSVGMGYENFRKQWERVTGVSPAHYRTLRRIEAARELLRYSPQMTNRQVAALLGFADEYHFSRRFTQFTGTTPRAFRQAH